MTALAALWLPILLSAVFIFIVSSVIHMAPLWHKSDFAALPDQEKAIIALRALAIPSGDRKRNTRDSEGRRRYNVPRK